jgi:chromosome partitioning protein
MKTISIMNQKGGSGKTTAAQHLAVVQASNGKKVLFIDTDKQQSGIKFFRKNVAQFPKGYDGVIDFLFAPDETLELMLEQHGKNYEKILKRLKN